MLRLQGLTAEEQIPQHCALLALQWGHPLGVCHGKLRAPKAFSIQQEARGDASNMGGLKVPILVLEGGLGFKV